MKNIYYILYFFKTDAILSNVEIESQQITNMTTENSSNDPHFNHRYTNLDVDLSQPNTIFGMLSIEDTIPEISFSRSKIK